MLYYLIAIRMGGLGVYCMQPNKKIQKCPFGAGPRFRSAPDLSR
jgi:hypothetical protein